MYKMFYVLILLLLLNYLKLFRPSIFKHNYPWSYSCSLIDKSNMTVTIVGIAVGGVAFIAVIIGVIFAVRCWYNKRDNNTNR